MSDYDEGQLCPYADCETWVDLLGDIGWKICPHCKQVFWYKSTDGDYEDYHCFQLGFRPDESPDMPIDVIEWVITRMRQLQTALNESDEDMRKVDHHATDSDE